MIENITIGSDPEMICADPETGNPLLLTDWIPKKGLFGVDGHPYLAELRPKSAIHPKDLSDNIRKTLLLGFPKLGFSNWIVSPWYQEKPMGGHIHFGLPFEDKYGKALDHYLAIILALIEPHEQAQSRRTKLLHSGGWIAPAPYGLLGDIRTKPWGFEYRTPSTFICTPAITTAILAVAKAIIYEELINGKFAWSSIKNQKKFMFREDDFYNCVKDKFISKIKDMRRILQSFTYFKQDNEGHDLWPFISYLFSVVMKKPSYPLSKDIKKLWKIDEESSHAFITNDPAYEKEADEVQPPPVQRGPKNRALNTMNTATREEIELIARNIRATVPNNVVHFRKRNPEVIWEFNFND